MRLSSALKTGLVAAALFFGWTGLVYGGAATNINGLYYTGVNNTYGLLGGGTTDPHWTVTYANVNGTSGNTTYQGPAYVVNGGNIDPGWVQNTGSAQWIVPPGASPTSAGGSTNTGGDYLPGNGTSGVNAASYTYTLAFQISGSGPVGSAVTNNVSISLTIASDDQYSIYVNPNLNGNGSVRTGSSTLAGSRTNAWNNTTSIYLQNFTDANGTANANFKIGTNYITVVVDNTNSTTGTSGSNALNPSGLLVYQVGAAMTINGNPVPEVGTWLPVVGALGIFVVRRFRPRKSTAASVG